MQCPRCGATVVSRARFCPVCGQQLLSEAQPSINDAVTVQVIPATPPESTMSPFGDTTQMPTSRLAMAPVVPQINRWWWKILLIGTGLYLAVNSVAIGTQNVFLLPQLFMIGTFLVPIVYVAYLYEDGTLYDVPLSKLALLFFFGGVVGSMAASLLEAKLIISNTKGFFGQLTLLNAAIVGLSEELAKLIVVVPFLVSARKRYPSLMYGIVFGAAAGMGFAAFESMGYAFSALGQNGRLEDMHELIRLRAFLAPLGHGTWTAIVAAAMWREVLSKRSPLNANVFVAFLSAVLLHLLWDYLPAPLIAGLPVLHIVLGLVGLLLLRFFLVGAKGAKGAAYQEKNLATAWQLYARGLGGEMRGAFRRRPRP